MFVLEYISRVCRRVCLCSLVSSGVCFMCLYCSTFHAFVLEYI